MIKHILTLLCLEIAFPKVIFGMWIYFPQAVGHNYPRLGGFVFCFQKFISSLYVYV